MRTVATSLFRIDVEVFLVAGGAGRSDCGCHWSLVGSNGSSESFVLAHLTWVEEAYTFF